MKSSEIKEGETYMFVATDSDLRKHLEGQPFTVVTKKKVWRRLSKGNARKVYRFINADGMAARADELEPMDNIRENKYTEWEQLAHDMENDIKRYPLPICFEPSEEQRELYNRRLRLQSIAKRWFIINTIKQAKKNIDELEF